MKFLSVCSGIEAASVAWEPLGWKPVLFSEIEAFPRGVLEYRQQAVDARRSGAAAEGVPLWGDFTAIRARHFSRLNITVPDVLVGGTPCQAFSVAGLRRSLDDDRGNLTLSFVRLANAIDNLRSHRGEPGLIITWENVPGVLSTKDNAFGCFLGALVGADSPLLPGKGQKWTNAGLVAGPKRKAAWRVLDAQHFGVPQRRRRVFVVASSRDDFDPGAVFFEPLSLRGNTPASKGASKDVAGTLTGGARTDGGFSHDDFPLVNGTIEAGIDRRRGSGMNASQLTVHALTGKPYADRGDGEESKLVIAGTLSASGKAAGSATQQDAESGLLIAYGGNNTAGPINVAAALNANRGCHSPDDFEAGTLLVEGTTHTLRGEGFDASEDGTGRGTPIIPVCFAENSRAEVRLEGGDGSRTGALSTGGGKPGQGVPCVAFSCKDYGNDAGETSPTLRAMNFTGSHANGGGQVAVALRAAVRRLTPRECERLQGFWDDYTLIPWGKRKREDCPDGPRYRALGNSMAVPVMNWLGRRIALVLDFYRIAA